MPIPPAVAELLVTAVSAAAGGAAGGFAAGLVAGRKRFRAAARELLEAHEAACPWRTVAAQHVMTPIPPTSATSGGK